ncbi:MAG: phosphodiester glycosidase family protein [Verrucomicrobiota bacterium]
MELSLQVEGGTAEMSAVRFDSRHFTLRVVDQPESWSFGDTLGSSMRSAGAIAGVNGGYFHPDFTPLGLMIANGRTLGQFTRSSLVSGMLRVLQGEPALIWNSESSSTAGASDLLQAGPRLVDRGQPVSGLNASKVAARTFLATDGKHHWLVGVVRSTTLKGLAKLLAMPNLVAGMRVDRALNLDGGRSTAFYVRTSDGREISQPGWSTVRSYVAVVPR